MNYAMPKSPQKYDYDLWKDENGRCFVRVKETAEVTEVSEDVMRLLRREEKRMRRASTPFDEQKEDSFLYRCFYAVNHPLSLNVSPEGMSEDDDSYGEEWYPSCADTEREAFDSLLQAEMAQQLAPRQEDVFRKCLLEEEGVYEYAHSEGISFQSAYYTLQKAKEKLKKFYESC